MQRLITSGALYLLLVGCAQSRDPLGEAACVSWRGQVQAELAGACGRCHGDAAAEGRYRVTEYLDAIGPGTDDVPNVRPGEPTSRLLTVLNQDDAHRVSVSVRDLLSTWVVQCDARLLDTALHAAGIQNPGQPDFHGELLRQTAYDFENCQRCHGADYAGGTSDSSCLGCHPAGPDDCSTCHAEVIDQGAHRVHVDGGTLRRPYDCAVCHVVPGTLSDPGHVFLADGAIDPPPVEVVFSGPALWEITPSTREGPPTYDPDTMTCRNVYCHGDTLEPDGEAQRTEPRWSDPPIADCANCHGAPPDDHANPQCGQCHGPVALTRTTVDDFARHLDGEIQLGWPNADRCTACHGRDDNPAPPADLDGRVVASTITVGAHTVHLEARSGLSAPVRCADCHVVPEALNDPDHIDSARPAEVFAAGLASLAFVDDAAPRWERETARCVNTYCHGGGTRLARDMSPGLLRTPVWNAPERQQVYCGSCHGVPPTTRPHDPTAGVEGCAQCHPGTVDAFGNILERNQHIDGILDL